METLNDTKNKVKDLNAGENSNTINRVEALRDIDNYISEYFKGCKAQGLLSLEVLYKHTNAGNEKDLIYIKNELIESSEYIYEEYWAECAERVQISEEDYLKFIKSLTNEELSTFCDYFILLDDEEIYTYEIRNNFNKDNAFDQLVEDLKYYYTHDESKIVRFANYDEETLKELIKDTDEQSYYNFDKFSINEKEYLFDIINVVLEADEEEGF